MKPWLLHLPLPCRAHARSVRRLPKPQAVPRPCGASPQGETQLRSTSSCMWVQTASSLTCPALPSDPQPPQGFGGGGGANGVSGLPWALTQGRLLGTWPGQGLHNRHCRHSQMNEQGASPSLWKPPRTAGQGVSMSMNCPCSSLPFSHCRCQIPCLYMTRARRHGHSDRCRGRGLSPPLLLSVS